VDTVTFPDPLAERNHFDSGGSEMSCFQEVCGSVGVFGGLRRCGFTLALTFVAVGLCAAVAVGQAQAQEINADLREALEYHRAGRLKDAVEIYTEVLEKNPSVVEALDWRAMAYTDLNELDAALADLNKAIQLAPNYADAYNNRGEVYRQKQMYRQAMSDYRKAAQIEKNLPEPHYNMALILEHEKNYSAAIGEYRKYLELQPKATDRKEIETKIDSLHKLAQATKPAQPPQKKLHASSTGPAPGHEQQARPTPGSPAQKRLPFTLPPKGAQPGELSGMPIPPGLMALFMGLGVASMALPLIVYVFVAVMLFLIAKKTATPLPWLAFIPIANLYLMVQIAGKPIWWLALVLVLPVVAAVLTPLQGIDPTGGIIVLVLSILCGLAAAVAYLLICLGVAAARGKSVVWGILQFIPCTSPIAFGYLGLSK
jgi:Tfp pilus assembly protein PilF